MSPIRAIRPAIPAAYASYRAAARADQTAPTPPIDSDQRAKALTSKLETHLSDKLAQIRQQISPDSANAPGGSSAAQQRLDIRA